MDQQSQSVRKTYTFNLMPSSAQERALERVVARCRSLYNAALEQRRTWWGRGQGIGGSYSQQARELPDRKAACPEYSEVHSQVLQDVLRRVDKTYQAFFQRVAAGQTPGSPRFQGATRFDSVTYPQYGHGAVLDGGSGSGSGILSLATIGRIGRLRVRLHRRLAGTPRR